jgi:hypothetical protein
MRGRPAAAARRSKRCRIVSGWIVAEGSQAPTPSADSTAATADSEIKLRQRNRDLPENLELAIAAIQRLTLQNRISANNSRRHLPSRRSGRDTLLDRPPVIRDDLMCYQPFSQTGNPRRTIRR